MIILHNSSSELPLLSPKNVATIAIGTATVSATATAVSPSMEKCAGA